MNGKILMTPEEVAARLKVAPRTVTGWLREGMLKGVRVLRLWRISEEALAEFLEERSNA